MDHLCPICKRALTKEDLFKYVDYLCWPTKKDHHYVERIRNGHLDIIKVRISPKDSKLFFKINYEKGFTECWVGGAHDANRIKIENTFVPDFTDMTKLEAKIRIWLLLS